MKLQFIQLGELADKLLKAIQDESWDMASLYIQQWDQGIRGLFHCLSTDQVEAYKHDFDNLVELNQSITENLSQVRAKSLTQLQEFNEFRIANKYYSNAF